jgi:hypothetical protein
MSNSDTLRFKVAPHIVEDLGLNLYTDLPRVLVEFVANAYDADSPHCAITVDFDEIERVRQTVKMEWEADRTAAAARRAAEDLATARGEELPAKDTFDGEPLRPLGERTLPEQITIVVEDAGHGMSRQELEDKFLVAGRRRRKEDPKGGYSENGRVVMGRKGLGKLAGFGVAHRVEVTSRRRGEAHATKVTLDYDHLVTHRSTDEIQVPAEQLDDGGGIVECGTRIVLSRLVYDPLKTRKATLQSELGQFFNLIDIGDFAIEVNGAVVEPNKREFVYAYPEPDRPVHEFVDALAVGPDGTEYPYKYRLRFTPRGQHLQARQRGVRVYAHHRLAAAPDLLDAPTGMHGFRNTDYLDGVMYADFIDDQPAEYIATDRQSLRWEVPLLEPVREFLSDQIKRACDSYQRDIEKKAAAEAQKDTFTRDLIERNRLTAHKKKIAYAIAGGLASHLPEGKHSPEYQQHLGMLVDALGQGNLLEAMAELAKEDSPDLNRVVAQAVELTEREVSEFMRFIDGRLDAIRALQKIVKNSDFKGRKNEKELHRLFERAPWLIDTTYVQFMTSDKPVHTTFAKLAMELGIAEYAPKPSEETNDTRPDLVFLLGQESSRQLVIVELKAPEVPLAQKHLGQLKGYMQDAKEFLRARWNGSFRIKGYLIGSLPEADSKAHEAKRLRYDMESEMDKSDWEVLDLTQVLERAKRAHEDLLMTYERVTGKSALAEFE